MTAPKLFNYNPNGKGQANSMAVIAGGRTYFFSYETCIAIEARGQAAVVSVNNWGPTSGKHINWAKNAIYAEPVETCEPDDLESKLDELIEAENAKQKELEKANK